MKQPASLVITGIGLRVRDHITPEAARAIQRAEQVLYIPGDVDGDTAIKELNPRAQSMISFYAAGKPLLVTYTEMVRHVVNCLDRGATTCLAVYGHPSLLVVPTHLAAEKARSLGFQVQVLPGISAEDCLFADLGIDPVRIGCQSYWASDFLVHQRVIEPSAALVLWGVGALSAGAQGPMPSTPADLQRLTNLLFQHYPLDHCVYVYEAAMTESSPVIFPTRIGRLSQATLNSASTLYVPPLRPPHFTAHA